MDPTDSTLYDYDSHLGTFVLTRDGRFYLRPRAGGSIQSLPWYKDSKTGKPWIVAKRRTFVSLVKQGIREGDFAPESSQP